MKNQHICFSQLTFGLFFIRIQYESDKLNILHIAIYITTIKMYQTFKVLTHMEFCSLYLKPNIQNQ
jgi:hypothetical protein